MPCERSQCTRDKIRIETRVSISFCRTTRRGPRWGRARLRATAATGISAKAN
jgi:hypothetical protein